ncbi:MAG: hypothetical protein K2X65_10615 [Burkholderiaceae bacterium]|jgi:hypothetical protein|nr:hypothetical protein [Burkholderiaceae bacterium]
MQNFLQIRAKKYSLTAAVLLATGLLAGCAAPGTGSTTAVTAVTTSAKVEVEDAVRTRAQQRWDWLMAGKFDDAYTYTTPSYRALNTAQDYRNRFSSGAKWVDPKVDSVTCESDKRCRVKIVLGIQVAARGFTKPTRSVIIETWLPEDGQWWFYQAP